MANFRFLTAAALLAANICLIVGPASALNKDITAHPLVRVKRLQREAEHGAKQIDILRSKINDLRKARGEPELGEREFRHSSDLEDAAAAPRGPNASHSHAEASHSHADAAHAHAQHARAATTEAAAPAADARVAPTRGAWNPGRDHPLFEESPVTDDEDWYDLPNSLNWDYDIDFNSRGKVSKCYGDMRHPGVLKECFEARSYKRELILTVASANQGQYLIDEQLINRIMQYEDVGFHHHLVFMERRDGCDAYLGWFPNAGCVWTDMFKEPPITEHRHVYERLDGSGWLWTMRWLIWTRAVQMGYNLLMLDLDVEVLGNPYKWFKSPALSKINMFSMMESWPNMKNPSINGGCGYVQNAQPAGAIAWLGQSVLDRYLRWYEPNEAWLVPGAVENVPENRPRIFEQSMVGEAVCSIIAGTPLFMGSLEPPGVEPNSEARTAFERGNIAKCDMRKLGVAHMEKVQFPPEWEYLAWGFRERFASEEAVSWEGFGEGEGIMRYAKVKLPWNHGAWDPTLQYGDKGGPYPGPRGECSADLRAWLADDGTPLWPEEDDPSDPHGLREREDLWAPMPHTIFSTFGMGSALGRRGWWSSKPRPTAVLAHWVTISSHHAKPWVSQIHGWWHWDVHTKLYGSQIFGPSTALEPLPRVVAFPLGFPVGALNANEMGKFHQQLLMAAMVAGRAPVWPEALCDSTGFRQEPAKKEAGPGHPPAISYSGVYHQDLVSVGAAEERDASHELHCYYAKPMEEATLKVSLSQPQFVHMLKLLKDESNIKASPTNTIWWNQYSSNEGPYYYDDDTVPVVEFSALKAAFDVVQDLQVVYIGKLFKIAPATVPTALAERHKALVDECEMTFARLNTDPKTRPPKRIDLSQSWK